MSDKFKTAQEFIDQKIRSYITYAVSELYKTSNESVSLVYPGAFITLYEQIPPPGFAVRDGSVITEASINAPLLFETLQLPENKWKLKSNTDWVLLSNKFGGVGGVPFFVLDIDNDTIRLPDTRGMHEEGFTSTETMGTCYIDTIRNIHGSVWGSGEHFSSYYGAIYGYAWGFGMRHGDHDNNAFGLNVARVVPTGPVFRPKSFNTLHCVYIGDG